MPKLEAPERVDIVGIRFSPNGKNTLNIGMYIIDYKHIDDVITYLEYWKKWKEQENEGNRLG